MSVVPFAWRRPWLLCRGAWTNRDRPDLARLRGISEPERFVWAILPHAARTFSACIVLLPAAAARAAAVGYLYCRILDTYEDLHPDPASREAALAAFATRLRATPMPPPPHIPEGDGRDARDEGHVLLVERCDLVDRVYQGLPAHDQRIIADLVNSMATGMQWSSRTFATQGGILVDEAQLLTYCRHVLGNPVVFATRLLHGEKLPAPLHEDAMVVGEMVQLANVTRDIEKDLRRGVGYHADLKPHLGTGPVDPDLVRRVRRDLVRLALRRVPAYRRLCEAVDLGRSPLPRASALLMLLFTSRHYRDCALRVGLPGWDAPRSTAALLGRAAPALLSAAWTRRALLRTEQDFLRAANGPTVTTAVLDAVTPPAAGDA